MMLGPAGALCCLAAGTAVGSWVRARKQCRLRMLQAHTEALGGIRLLLEQEKPALCELLSAAAGYVGTGCGADETAKRLILTSEQLRKNPYGGLEQAYLSACAQIAAPWEQEEEKAVMEMFFSQLGCGTAVMREQAAAACLRKLKPLMEEAQTEADRSGKLSMQLGVLLGLMAGIALW